MSNHPTGANSPSNSSKPASTRATPEASKYNSSSTSLSNFEETPQSPAEQATSIAQLTPTIIVTGSPDREGHTLEEGHEHSTSSQDPATQSQETASFIPSNMSSASSSPGNTSTSGSSSGSNVQLPYAPFPYPIPANTRGGK